MRLLAVLALLLLVAGCDASSDAASLSGRWITLASAQLGERGDLDLTLSFADDGNVIGSGTLAEQPAVIGDPIPGYRQVGVTGSFDDQTIGLVLRYTDVPNSSTRLRLDVDRTSCTPSLSCDAVYTHSNGDTSDLVFLKIDD